jgi:hypothetical protein
MGRVWAVGVICLAVGGCAKLDVASGNMFGSTGKAEATQQMSYQFNETPVTAPAAEPAPTRHKAKQAHKRTRARKAATPAQAAPEEAAPASE